MDKELEKYVKTKLSQTLLKIRQSKRNSYSNELNEYEKSIIYHYTEDGYENLNESLREGGEISIYGQYLSYSLNKLPDYKLICYRAIRCNKNELEKYYAAYQNNLIITENTFLSCSKSKIQASFFSESPLFIIKSRKGKDIEKIAKFGIDSKENEKEILFKPNSKFRVLEIREENNKIVITLEEI